MLRIHIEQEPEAPRIRLEGKLIHPWVAELVQAWMDLVTRLPRQTPIQVDLSAVSFVDARGRTLLASMLKAGCSLDGTGPYISAVIEEVRSSIAS
jgi:ABC-type transporter Mla MlaB component